MKLNNDLHKNFADDNNNIFWVTMTDLMTSMVLVFMILFFYSYISNNMSNINQQIAKTSASGVLQKSLHNKNVNASIDPITGVVKISDLELFDVNDYKLSPRGKVYLLKFTPAYLDSIFKNDTLSNNIDKIIVQGHTDSQTYKGDYSKDQQYMKNMKLSMDRAYEVANFMINTPYNKINGDKLRKMIIVEGASFSSPIIEYGHENYEKSRRVELKLVMKQK